MTKNKKVRDLERELDQWFADYHDEKWLAENLEAFRGVEPPFESDVDDLVIGQPASEFKGLALTVYAARLVKRLCEPTSPEYEERFDQWLGKYLANRRSRGGGGRPRVLETRRITAQFAYFTEWRGLKKTLALREIAKIEGVDIRTVRKTVQEGLSDPRLATLFMKKKGKNL